MRGGVVAGSPASGWRDPRLAAAFVAAMFVAVFVVRTTVYNPNDGLGLFYVIPIAVAAARFGPIVGVGCGLAAFALYVAWAHGFSPDDYVVAGYGARLTVFVSLGWFVGYFARARALADLEVRRGAEHVRQVLRDAQDDRQAVRRRAAGDLHDFVLQPLIVSLMHVEELTAGATDERTARHAAAIDQLVRQASSSVRRLIDGIEPMDLQFMSTQQALEHVVGVVEAEHGVAVDAAIDVDGELEDELRVLAWRVAGEALRNAAKHARASTIEFDAARDGEQLVLEARDDGAGLAEGVTVEDALSPAFGTGFNLLVEQVLASGGGVLVRSRPGAGTTVRVELPLGAPAPRADG